MNNYKKSYKPLEPTATGAIYFFLILENSAETKACTPFKWNNQKDPLTSGIWIWSEPLEVVLTDGTKVYVLLVDCQGCFDESTSINEDANIFAFATLLSSVQIFNIKHQIDESTLQFLELFTGIARRIKLTCLKGSPKSSDVSFQKLTILVRDFQLQGYDYGYSNSSGPATANYKVDKLDPKSHQPLSHQRERSNIITSYQECGVFLLPHPGKKFTASDDPKDLDEDFLQVEKELLDVLFNPTNIVVKIVNGATQNGTTLKTHVEHWAEELENSELPYLPRTSESVNRYQLLDSIEGAKRKYRSGMELFLRGNQYQIAEEDLHKKHKSLVEESVSTFSSHLILFGGNEEKRKFEVEVEKNLREIYQNMQDKNLLKTVHRWYHYFGNAVTWAVPVVGTVSRLMAHSRNFSLIFDLFSDWLLLPEIFWLRLTPPLLCFRNKVMNKVMTRSSELHFLCGI